MDIGEHLRGIRSRLTPAGLGLPDTGVRRVPGLRREEVAVLAGISVDYYTRLEQGREKNPSPQVVESLCRGLALTGDAREHLYRLAGHQAPVGGYADQVRPELAALLGRWQHQPAFVLTATLDVLAPNLLARALFSGFAHPDNLARMVFLDAAARAFYTDWHRAAESVVASLRHHSTRTDADAFDPFIDEMSAASPAFRDLWAQQRVRGKTHAVKRFRHREVGELVLHHHAFDLPGTAGWQVIVYDAEPGTASADALALLRLSSAPADGEVLPRGEGAPWR